MHIHGEAQTKTKEGSDLWRRAPIWRWSVIGATICTGLLVLTQILPDPGKVEATHPVAHSLQKETREAAQSNIISPDVRQNSKATTPSANIPKPSAVRSPQPEMQSDLGISHREQRSKDRIAIQSPTHASHQPIESHSKAIDPKPTTDTQSISQDAEARQPNEQANANACGTQISKTSPPLRHSILKVVGFMSRSQALALLDQTQKQVGMQISPRYVDNQRVLLQPISGHVPRATVALVPSGMQVKIGDIVDYTTGFKLDAQFPCNYVPNLIDHVVETAVPIEAPALGSQDSDNKR